MVYLSKGNIYGPCLDHVTSYISLLFYYASNYIINSLLPLIINRISYLVIFICTISSSILVEDVLECSMQIGCKRISEEEPKEDKCLIVLVLSDPATLRINARQASIIFQYFS